MNIQAGENESTNSSLAVWTEHAKKKVVGLVRGERNDAKKQRSCNVYLSVTCMVTSWMDLETSFGQELTQITCDHCDPPFLYAGYLIHVRMLYSSESEVRIMNVNLTQDFILKNPNGFIR